MYKWVGEGRRESWRSVVSGGDESMRIGRRRRWNGAIVVYGKFAFIGEAIFECLWRMISWSLSCV